MNRLILPVVVLLASHVATAQAAKIRPSLGTKSLLKAFANHTAAFSNRKYGWSGIPATVRGWAFTRIPGGAENVSLSVRTLSGGPVYVANTVANRKAMESQGWAMENEVTFHYTDKDKTRMAIYRKQFKARATIQIPQIGWTGTMLLVPPGALSKK